MILRVDARSATARENTSHAVTRPRMVAELVVKFTDPGIFWYSGAAASLLLDGEICSVIEHQQDQLMYQQMVIDEAGAARTPVPRYAQEHRGKPVDFRIGNERGGTLRCGNESVGRIVLAWNERCSRETSEAACVHVDDAHERSSNPDDHEIERSSEWTRDLETISGRVGASEQRSISSDADAVAAMSSHGRQRSSLGGVGMSCTAVRGKKKNKKEKRQRLKPKP